MTRITTRLVDYQNCLQLFAAGAASAGPQAGLTVIDYDGVHQRLPLPELHRDAMLWAGRFREAGLQAGDVLLINLAHSPELFQSWLGAVYLGAIPAMFPTLLPGLSWQAYGEQLKELVVRNEVKALLTIPQMAAPLTFWLADTGCRVWDAAELGRRAAEPYLHDWQAVSPEATMLLQFSSGTTGAKKGVRITHGRILQHFDAVAVDRLGVRSDDVPVNWLPMHHDMGLLGAFLMPLGFALHGVLIAPDQWLRNPKLLFEAISRYRGTITYMPNFAFNHSVRGVRARDLDGLDLSSWRQLMNAAEPVRLESIQAFVAKFAPYGFDSSAILAAYGMAENTVAISLKRYDEPLRTEWIDGRALREAHRADPADPADPEALAQVSCGRPIAGTDLLIADDAGQPLPDRSVGEIWLRGMHLFDGYYRQPELTAQAFVGDWFKTGDLGYTVEGEVFVVGRKKDLIIVGGRNIYPEDVEEIISRVPGVRPGRVAAFGLYRERTGTEEIALVCEPVDPTLLAETDEAHALGGQLATEVRQLVASALGVSIFDVRLVEKGWVLKSSSGKVARGANRDKYLAQFGPRA